MAIHVRDNDFEMLKNVHVRFTYRTNERYCGYVQSASITEFVVRLTLLERQVYTTLFDIFT